MTSKDNLQVNILINLRSFRFELNNLKEKKIKESNNIFFIHISKEKKIPLYIIP